MEKSEAKRNLDTEAEGEAIPSAGEPIDDIDPEGWMRERPTYWLDLPEPEPPTRAAWMRHRALEFASWLHLARSKSEPEVSEEEWIALSEQALGPLPRPVLNSGTHARSATPNAQGSARKPPAYSPEPAGQAATEIRAPHQGE